MAARAALLDGLIWASEQYRWHFERRPLRARAADEQDLLLALENHDRLEEFDRDRS
jgi:hypothetical protein